MQFTKALLLFSISMSAYTQVELQTKQALNKIRFISGDGKVTYYQKNSGELQMSTNYSFATVIKGTKNTQYHVNASSSLKRLAIEANSEQFSRMNLQKNNTIYTTLYKDKKPATKVGNGVFPRLHLEDSWLSYFDHEEREIILKSFNTSVADKKIKLGKHLNHFFIPNVLMLTPNDVLYTDINKTGHMALLAYSFIEKSFKTVYKTKFPGHKISFCRLNDKVFIGEFPYLGVNSASTIVGMDIFNNENYKNFTTYYSSDYGDLGNLHCLNKQVYFVKTTSYNTILRAKQTEVASLNPTNKKVSLKSNLKNISQLTNVGEMLLATGRGKYYIIEGQNTTQVDKIQGKGEE